MEARSEGAYHVRRASYHHVLRQFFEGFLHGWASKSFPGGDAYSGMYCNDLRQGYGEYFWQHGRDTYRGYAIS